jgi:hypothetical protein
MQSDESTEKWDHRGPLPPWPTMCDLATWLAMETERAEHLRRSRRRMGIE